MTSLSLHNALFSASARRWWTAAMALLTIAMVALALLPTSPDAPTVGWDKANHALAFAAIAVCGTFGSGGGSEALLRLAFGLLLLGIGIEFTQSLLPYRLAEWQDVAANAVGIVLGMATAQFTAARLERRRQLRVDDMQVRAGARRRAGD
jgi:VanZ family protein